MTLLVSLEIAAILYVMCSAALFNVSTELRITQNYKRSVEAFYVAEAGLVHAQVALVPRGHNYHYKLPQALVKGFQFSPGYTYTVTVTNDPPGVDDSPRAVIISTASGPGGTSQFVKAYVERDVNDDVKILSWYSD